MRWAMIAIVVWACLGQRIGLAAPVDVSLEWVELDCTKCPELAARFQSAAVQRCDASFADLEKRAAKRVLVQHRESIEPGAKTKHTTRINETTLGLELTIRVAEKGVYETALFTSLQQGPELIDLKPGTQLTTAQMRGVKSVQTVCTLKLSLGESRAIGFVDKRFQEERTSLEAFADFFSAKKVNDSTVIVLVVGVKSPDPAKPKSQVDTAK